MHKVTIGSVEITALLDAPFWLSPQYFVPEHADEMIRDWGHKMNERGLIQNAITCYLVRSAGKNVLVDTGAGPRKRAGLPLGTLPDALSEAGITPADIDVVIHTHLHTDHVGWNTVDTDDGKREIFFPNARFIIQQAEWDYWMTPERLAAPNGAHLRECVEPLTNTGRITFMQSEEAFDENLVFIPSPGHTPGHVAVGIASGGERGIIIGDASHHAVQLEHPDWSPALDSDPLQSAKSRDQMIELAIREDRLWAAGHWEHPGLGRIVRVDGKRIFRAL